MSENRLRLNGLTELVDGLCGVGPYGGQTIARPYTLAEGNAYTPLTLNRILLSYSYMTQGLIQTVINQPVEDAFRGGITIKCPEIAPDELKALQNDLKKCRRRNKFARAVTPNAQVNPATSDIGVIKSVLNWSRLYGGSGLIVNTDQDFRTPLDIEAVDKSSPLEFIAADRWELILSQMNIWDERNPTPYNYYGLPLHRTRVVKVLGIEAPSYIRLRLQGWGMSEIERCIRSINSFVKFENLIFELLDEAKIDVYQIEGFNDQLLSDEATENTQRRIQLSNRIKNFQSALVMDTNDKYAQKQITWSGLAEMWGEIRLNLSSALKMPMNKLFGQSATGFGGGQDAIENYNSVVEGVRNNAEPVVTEVVDLRMHQRFGYIPDYQLEWQPLKLLDGEQEEKVKTSKQNRTVQLFTQRLITGLEASRILKADNLLHMDTEVSEGLREVEPTAPNEGTKSPKPEGDAPAEKEAA